MVDTHRRRARSTDAGGPYAPCPFSKGLQMSPLTRSRRAQAALASMLALPLALGACGGDDSGGGSSSGGTTTLRVLDYYNNDPGKTTWQKAIEACGQQAGVTISREAVPGASLIQKVLQQASSRTLPDL